MSLITTADCSRTLTFDIAFALSGAGVFSLMAVALLRLLAY